MAELTKKYIDNLAAEALVTNIKAEDAKTLQAAKDFATGLAENYDAAGAAATAKSEAIADADAKFETVNENIAKKADQTALEAEATTARAAEQAAQSAADAAQADVDALKELVGVLPEGTTAKDVVDYVNVKTAGIATDAALGELQSQLSGVQGEVTTIKGDYLKAADKEELEGKINLKADQTALDEVSGVANAAVKQADYDVKVKALEDEDVRIAGLVATEAETARAAEEDLAGRIKAVEDDYLKAADKQELQGNIDTLTGVVETLRDGIDAEKVDGVKDLIDYVEEHGTEVTGMKADIKSNADAIAEHVATNHDFAAADTALKNELNAEIAKKVDQTAYDEAIAGLQGEDTAIKGRLDALEGAVGESGSVAEDIADAEQRAKDAAAEDATTKADAAKDAAIAKANELNTAMNTRVEALEAVDHEHANKELLDTYTQTEANLADAVAKKHAHENATVLDGITAEKVSAWDAAESNAIAKANELNTAMTTKVDAIDTRLETAEGAVATKAEASVVSALSEKVTTNETNIAANTSAINSFVAISTDEINAMFA